MKDPRHVETSATEFGETPLNLYDQEMTGLVQPHDVGRDIRAGNLLGVIELTAYIPYGSCTVLSEFAEDFFRNEQSRQRELGEEKHLLRDGYGYALQDAATAVISCEDGMGKEAEKSESFDGCDDYLFMVCARMGFKFGKDFDPRSKTNTFKPYRDIPFMQAYGAVLAAKTLHGSTHFCAFFTIDDEEGIPRLYFHDGACIQGQFTKRMVVTFESNVHKSPQYGRVLQVLCNDDVKAIAAMYASMGVSCWAVRNTNIGAGNPHDSEGLFAANLLEAQRPQMSWEALKEVRMAWWGNVCCMQAVVMAVFFPVRWSSMQQYSKACLLQTSVCTEFRAITELVRQLDHYTTAGADREEAENHTVDLTPLAREFVRFGHNHGSSTDDEDFRATDEVVLELVHPFAGRRSMRKIGSDKQEREAYEQLLPCLNPVATEHFDLFYSLICSMVIDATHTDVPKWEKMATKLYETIAECLERVQLVADDNLEGWDRLQPTNTETEVLLEVMGTTGPMSYHNLAAAYGPYEVMTEAPTDWAHTSYIRKVMGMLGVAQVYLGTKMGKHLRDIGNGFAMDVFAIGQGDSKSKDDASGTSRKKPVIIDGDGGDPPSQKSPQERKKGSAWMKSGKQARVKTSMRTQEDASLAKQRESGKVYKAFGHCFLRSLIPVDAKQDEEMSTEDEAGKE